MKEYPSIPHVRDTRYLGHPCYVYEKHDGSNLRWEWSRKRGFYKSGTRERLFDSTDPDFCAAIPIFEAIAPTIVTLVTKRFRGIQKFTVFTELWGYKSFAGTHQPDDDSKTLNLFDVWLNDSERFIKPVEFARYFPRRLDDDFELWMPLELYRGNLNSLLITEVRTNTLLARPLNEGVVCKGTDGDHVWMTKIKTNEFLERLRGKFGADWQRYE